MGVPHLDSNPFSSDKHLGFVGPQVQLLPRTSLATITSGRTGRFIGGQVPPRACRRATLTAQTAQSPGAWHPAFTLPTGARPGMEKGDPGLPGVRRHSQELTAEGVRDAGCHLPNPGKGPARSPTPLPPLSPSWGRAPGGSQRAICIIFFAS